MQEMEMGTEDRAMAATVYHGASFTDMLKVVSAGERFWTGMYVTDAQERAATYANARATGMVSKDGQTLAPHAAIAIIETDEELRWISRPASHASLDQAEAICRSGRVVAVVVRECDYWNCDCHGKAEAIRHALRAE